MDDTRYTSTVFQQNGHWYGAIRWKQDGKWKRKTRKFGEATSRRRANAFLKEWEAELDFRTASLEEITIMDYVRSYIEKKSASRSIEPSTAIGYMNLLPYLKPISGLQLRDLTRGKAQSFINSLVEKGYSNSTVKHVYTLGRGAYRHARDEGLVSENPFEGVSTPKKKLANPNFLDADARARLKDYLGGGELTRVKVAAYIAMYCGLRQGEVCGLRWRDVDVDRAMMTVSRSIGRCEGGFHVKATKTDQIRTAPIPKALKEILERWHDIYMDECEEAGVGYMDTGYLIGYPDGSYMNPTILGRQWRGVTDALSLVGSEGTRCTFHDLRHTFATAAIAGGVDVKTVSSILGHANAAMTLNIYASADPNAKAAAAKVMDAVI